MRLIDADALMEKVQFRNPIDNHNAEVIAGCVNLTRRIIDNSPIIDAVPVVRCKDCVFRSGLTGAAPFMYHYCHRGVGLSGEVKDDDFCSYGERKDGEG